MVLAFFTFTFIQIPFPPLFLKLWVKYHGRLGYLDLVGNQFRRRTILNLNSEENP